MKKSKRQYDKCPECGRETRAFTVWHGVRMCDKCAVVYAQRAVMEFEDVRYDRLPSLEKVLAQTAGCTNLGEAQARIDTRDYTLTVKQKKGIRRNMEKHGVPLHKRTDWYHGVTLS